MKMTLLLLVGSSSSMATSTFGYTGSLQNYMVPAGVQSVTVALWGAGGAGSAWNPIFTNALPFAGGSASQSVTLSSMRNKKVLYEA